MGSRCKLQLLQKLAQLTDGGTMAEAPIIPKVQFLLKVVMTRVAVGANPSTSAGRTGG